MHPPPPLSSILFLFSPLLPSPPLQPLLVFSAALSVKPVAPFLSLSPLNAYSIAEGHRHTERSISTQRNQNTKMHTSRARHWSIKHEVIHSGATVLTNRPMALAMVFQTATYFISPISKSNPIFICTRLFSGLLEVNSVLYTCRGVLSSKYR